KAWGFEGSGSTPPTPQTAYEGKVAKIPGKIETELYDVSGTRDKAYRDVDSENQGDAEFRADEGVDIVLGGSGMAIGYTSEGEWLEYTVNVEKAGKYAISASASTGAEQAGFSLEIDGKQIGDEFVVSQTGEDWSVYTTVKGGTVELPAGEQIIRLNITGSNVNVDWLKFEAMEGDKIIEIPDAIASNINLNTSAAATYDVFDISGQKIASFVARSMTEAVDVWKSKGVKQGMNLIRNRTTGQMSKVRILR
ncbi:MAG: carbohydrate-binding protein, partial [Fibrobacter sp.]|nr:carbohydrate-binding protein [Fibrobacter sp.]